MSAEGKLPRPNRAQYKSVWTELSDTYDKAKMHVIGSVDEVQFQATAEKTLGVLRRTVDIRPDDVVLEIGCGIGRVGHAIAPLCRRWIGADVSPRMLDFARERLRGFPNVELRELSGYNLDGIPDAAATVVYCTIVFMHLESWDRYGYVLDAYRVLRPGGRIYVDNANLCSDAGWRVFESHRQFPPAARPPHMTECSTPQEIETYLTRAGFQNVRLLTEDDFVRGWAVKP